MSTRATYRIKEAHPDGDIIQYFYIHYDGYPEGAASYFKEMLANFETFREKYPIGVESLSFRRGKAIIAFGMLQYAEYTADHEEHGDTEYYYDLFYIHPQNLWRVKATKINRGSDEGRNDKVLFQGPLQEFITNFLPIKEMLV